MYQIKPLDGRHHSTYTATFRNELQTHPIMPNSWYLGPRSIAMYYIQEGRNCDTIFITLMYRERTESCKRQIHIM